MRILPPIGQTVSLSALLFLALIALGGTDSPPLAARKPSAAKQAAPVATPTPSPTPSASASPVPIDAIDYRVLATYPHDPRAFTEGLLFRDGELIESTGMEGESDIRRVKISDGSVIQSVKLPAAIFGEGIAALNNTLYSVTWHGGHGYRWTLPGLKQAGTLSYQGEGWGMTSDGHSIILSDGTPVIRFMDPKHFAVTRTLSVTANGRPLRNLNELEWVDGQLYANVWQTQWIVRIDPVSGAVTGALDTTALMQQAGGDLYDNTPNGIAWDPATRTLYVVGKRWTTLFALKIDPPTP